VNAFGGREATLSVGEDRLLGVKERRIGLWLHSSRVEAIEAAAELARGLSQRGIECLVALDRAGEVQALAPDLAIGSLSDGPEIELLVVLGGDGTILSAAEWALPAQVPLLGVNMGHVGFLAELEASEIDDLVERVALKRYVVEERVMLAVEVRSGDEVWQSFALNELSIEKAVRSRMIDVLVSVDDHPLSRWACDGILVSTPSGSTAYAFSAGGPVIWPDVEAIELVPLLAHALFARPLVLSPDSVIEIYLMEGSDAAAFWCDGRRKFVGDAGAVAIVTRNALNLRFARLDEQPFTNRLVRKFQLPVDGWRHGKTVEGTEADTC